jgi:hypothetical protein
VVTGTRVKCGNWYQGHHVGLFNDERLETKRIITVVSKACR